MGDQLDLSLLDGPNDSIAEKLQEEMMKSSGRYLKERNPKLYQVIVVALSYGVPDEALARGTGVSPNTVAAIRREVKPIAFEDHKKHILEGLRQARHSILRRVTELLDSEEKIPLGTLALAFGILTDKEALESGGVTSRVQVVEDPETTEFMRLLAGMRQGAGMGLEQPSLPANSERADGADPLPGPIVDVTSETVPGNPAFPASPPSSQATMEPEAE